MLSFFYFKAISLKMSTSFIAADLFLNKLSVFQMVYCTQAECLYLPIWENCSSP